MNLNDIKEYVTTKKEKMFSKLLDKDHEVVQGLFNKFGNDRNKVNWTDVEEYYQEYLNEVKKSKRKWMTYYNKK